MNKEEILNKILSRGVIKQILPTENEFKKALLGDKPLKFYIGADATGSSLHLSHAKNFMLLEEFRRLGHKVYLLFGDLTACIGDPTDRDSVRARTTKEMAKQNAKSWISQIGRLIDFNDKTNPAEVVFNSTWFDEFSVRELLELLSNATVQQMIERDMFQKRIKENKPIFLHEFLYPMFQGYDSVVLDVDVELCGTDQIFNALIGRELLKKYKNKEKFIVAVNLMENPKTGELMSKSKGTGVFLGTDAKTIFGQIMSQPDEMIKVLLINNTRVPLEDIEKLNIDKNPRDAKIFTAKEITKILYGEYEAEKAYQSFIDTFTNREFPSDAPIITINQNEIKLLDLINICQPELSKSKIKQLIKQNSISINDEKFSDIDANIVLQNDDKLKLKIGKTRFFKIIKNQ